MRTSQWLRLSLFAASTVAVAAAGIVACSDDASTVKATPKTDASTPPAPAPDASSDASADGSSDAGKKVLAKIQLVNAASDFGPTNPLGSLRVCYQIGPLVAGLPPLPNTLPANSALPYPGVPAGAGGAVQVTGADLSGLGVTPYLMNAKAMFDRGALPTDAGAPGTSCSDLLNPANDGGAALVEGVDYWKLPELPAGTFGVEESVLLVLTGCTGDSTLNTSKCGADWAASTSNKNGNLKISVLKLDRKTAIAEDKFGAQFVHASPAASSLLGANAVIPALVLQTPDGGADAGNTIAPLSSTPVALDSLTPLVQVSGVDIETSAFTANAANPALQTSLKYIRTLSYGGNIPEGGDYRNGAAFTFIAVGDPEITLPPPNLKGFHYLALPNDPVNPLFGQ